MRELQALLRQATSSHNTGERLPFNDGEGGDDLGPWESRLTLDAEGRVSLHGPTSIFSAPFISSSRDDEITTDDKHAEIRREQLVTNAWVQRAAEAISSEDVCI